MRMRSPTTTSTNLLTKPFSSCTVLLPSKQDDEEEDEDFVGAVVGCVVGAVIGDGVGAAN